MEIDIKFNVGDTIWFMFRNKPNVSKVRDIVGTIKIKGGNTPVESVIYTPDNNTPEIGQYRCFATKEELLKSL